jgi:hypothetical protein
LFPSGDPFIIACVGLAISEIAKTKSNDAVMFHLS